MRGVEMMVFTPDIRTGPEVVGTGKCTVGKHHVFDRFFGEMPCMNCNRDFCRTHAAKEPESELTPPLCAECGAAYRAEGTAGLRRVKERLFRTHGS